ncbi:MAG: hypothetical protein mread185_000133 [Mycoplasmataceae bacterium]|nr:MAG: hypothetical protein mread185_000133 [Mycoplasmataceae bacterium]
MIGIKLLKMELNNKSFPKKWEFWLVKFEKTSEDRKSFRPALIISDDIRNEFDNLIVVIPTTTENLGQTEKFEVLVKKNSELKLDNPCKLQFFYPRTIDKKLRLVACLGMANRDLIEQAKKAWKYSFDVDSW